MLANVQLGIQNYLCTLHPTIKQSEDKAHDSENEPIQADTQIEKLQHKKQLQNQAAGECGCMCQRVCVCVCVCMCYLTNCIERELSLPLQTTETCISL